MHAIEARQLFLGAAGAAALGLAFGGLFRPDVTPQANAREMTSQPQAQFDDLSPLAAYHGRVPDYVIGTDWLPGHDSWAARAAVAKATPSPAYREAVITDADPTEYLDYADSRPVDDDIAAPEAVPYPSEGGDILAGLHPVEPQPPVQELELPPAA